MNTKEFASAHYKYIVISLQKVEHRLHDMRPLFGFHDAFKGKSQYKSAVCSL